MYKQLKKMRQEEGFTLIELLIVIVILGILAAIVVFSVQGITDRGHSAACKTDVSEVQTAVEAFYAQSTATPPVYPQTLAALSGFLQSTPTDVTLTPGTTPSDPVTVAGIGC